MLKDRLSADELLELESRGCFDYFWEEANAAENSAGYGLISDRSPGNPEIASIASVGFGFAAGVIGAHRGYKPKSEIEHRVIGTLRTLLNTARIHGFFFHFLNKESAERAFCSEISVIDTAIAVCGALTAGEYFGGEARQLASQLYESVEWPWFADDRVQMFHMGYSPEKGFFNYWDEYAEQFMMYFLGAGSPTFPSDPNMFYSFSRKEGYYGGVGPIIHSTSGSLFVYQYSHAFFDLRGKIDRLGTDWWQNSVNATLANRQYCINEEEHFHTFHENSWGLTACDGPGGYNGSYGAPPREVGRLFGDINHGNDGTVSPCGAVGSIAFTPDYSQSALLYYYQNCSGLFGKYGFKDAYNRDVSPEWVDRDYIGIDKGISLLMIENYRTGLIWNVFMKNEYAQRGMKACGVFDRMEAAV